MVQGGSSSSSGGASKVRVAVRIRPLTSKEIQQGGKLSLNVSPPSVGIGQRQFTYDSVFDSHTGQIDLYESISTPLLRSFIDGYNATIMAYGQTGSGKTFTMGSEAHLEPEDSSHSGLIPRFMSDFFENLKKKKEASDVGKDGAPTLLEYRMEASFLEVYGEDVFDLLDEGRQSLPLREDSNGGVVISGLTSRPIATATEALKVLHEGTMNRTTAATLMNLTSSRSHAVFTITLSQITRSESCGEMDVTTTSRFTFVDLAGSERMKKTGAEGERAREGIKINEGLLALGNVINALADEERLAKEKKIHVPYRQSKLTRLLQDALGGNSQTLFLACVSPSDTNASETLSTLHYANRARNIRNAPTKNMDATAAEIQRLHALTHVLQCELIKQRFQDTSNDDEKIGQINQELLKRKEVVDYLQLVTSAVVESQDAFESFPATHTITATTAPTMEFPTQTEPQIQIGPTITHPLDSTPNKTISERIDDSFLVDVNPDEDMAILDKLLELQHNDHEYDKENRRDTLQLKQMEGELEIQENMLLQLRDSLKVYHNMKDKFEVLMTEVQQLETEKATLAGQLEKTTADPSKGCSAAIKKKLEKVESSLARARDETRKHREKFRKAEQQAQKCRVLERKIGDLKQAKVTLIKKQKEATARYRNITESKTRELLILKRKEKVAGQRMSKLETEVRHHKANLQKRKTYCDKLSDKLKQTETHLMKLLSLRKREVNVRTSLIGNNRRRSSVMPQNDKPFIPSEEEIRSMKYVLDKMVRDKVDQSNLKLLYEERVAAYSDIMRDIVAEVELLNEARQKERENQSDEWNATIQDREEVVADLELKLELVSSELEDLGSKMPQQGDSSLDGDEAVEKMMSNMPAPLLRTLLMETFSRFADAEMERQSSAKTIERKDAALTSFEREVETLNNKIAVLSKDLSDNRSLLESGEDPLLLIKTLEEEKSSLKTELQSAGKRLEDMNAHVEEMEMNMKRERHEHAETKEAYTLAKTSLERQNGNIACKEVIEQVQVIWEQLGVETEVREASRKDIEKCLEDTCARKLSEATALKAQTEEEIRKLSQTLSSMQVALGVPEKSVVESTGSTLFECLENLRTEMKEVEPQFRYAIERKDKVLNEVVGLSKNMGLSVRQLPSNLQTLIQQNPTATAKLQNNKKGSKASQQKRASMMKDIKHMIDALSAFETTDQLSNIPEVNEGEQSMEMTDEREARCSQVEKTQNLHSGFLSSCENEVIALRVQKSEILVRNNQIHQKASALIRDMHLSPLETIDLVLNRGTERRQQLPEWWNREVAEDVARSVDTSGGTVDATLLFSQHLEFILESLDKVAYGRRSLSSSLRGIVERAQKTLLDIVGRELDASEAYASFHDALFRLPALSKELSDTCITEMDALVTGVEAMTQSEIEALTLIWEALSVSSADRRSFWGEVDEASTEMEKQRQNPFGAVSAASECEQWVLEAVKKANKGYRELEKKLFKLDRIHQEVEKLRSRQDSKSRILSLDSELRILNAKLSEFEETKCSKQRLLTKKAGSSTLLKEERFRKQMQGKFTSKLEQLANLLRAWNKDEGKSFDSSLLSEDVRHLLDDPDKMETWVKQRTKFMPLRTVSTARKRPIDDSPKRSRSRSALRSTTRDNSGASPPRKRVAHAQSTNKLHPSTRRGRQKPQLRSRESPAKTRVTRSAATRRKVADTSKTTISQPSHYKAKSPIKSKKDAADSRNSFLPFGHVLSEAPSPNVGEDKENSYP